MKHYQYDTNTFVGRGNSPEEAIDNVHEPLQQWLKEGNPWSSLQHSTSMAYAQNIWIYTLFVTVVRTIGD